MKTINSSDYYDKLGKSFQNISQKRACYLKEIDSLVALSSKSADPIDLLDIGTGDGIRLNQLLPTLNINSVTVIEPSIVLCEEAKKYLPQAIFENCDFSEANVSSNGYSHIYALWNVLGHVNDINGFFSKISQCLKPGGVFIFDVNNRYNITNYGFFAVAKNILKDIFKVNNRGFYDLKIDGNLSSVYIYTESELKGVINNAGLVLDVLNYLNYETGKRVRSQWGGQLFMVVRKPR